MAKVIEGTYEGKGLKFGIVVSRFNEFVTKSMLEGALNELRRSGVLESAMTVSWVPGAYEIPVACQTMAETKTFDALITLGCIIRGETTHYEHIAQSVCNGIQKVALDHCLPVGLGVLTVEDMEQAMDRAGGKQGNKGRDAARSALEMVHVIRELKSATDHEVKIKQLMAREFEHQ
ncbi:MAG: 6,7-dimethyl-8-ribityllumazine synthase [Omnitrophica bacterium RIFCSPHIGHO2_02_FULL_46_11]|nr:MAG: 6,7-dimethyl-8-ribityllumazine synthase [Omnitrophica bacterium RIFCSPHIGHO2_02_FULL_46_11]OGW86776.1 MAG: 6,7-dimethyl-8-ribityllumazine synthase [Omnitrophica bacterium RIFCSPLOWO2_01_FULL_45_10b]